MKKADVILKVLGAGLVKAKQCIEERERNHLPVNHCRSKEKNRAAQSNFTQHAWHVASMGKRPDQPNATGIQIITKITDSREGERELTADNITCLNINFM